MMKATDSFSIFLSELLDQQGDCATLQAMKYSLLSGGKRLRPRLLWTISSNLGADYHQARLAGAIIEMIHCYSLIHDDLPALDNDTLRRGVNTCHIEFDEATAILAGDGLLTLAFLLVGELEEKYCQKVLTILAGSCGIGGMIAGQDKDIKQLCTDLSSYREMVIQKTGCLFAAALMIGAVIADHLELLDDLKNIGFLLGYAFQIQDDLLEVQQSVAVTGKSASDQLNEKATIVSLLGLKPAIDEVNKAWQDVDLALNQLPRAFPALVSLIDEIKERSY